jgi:D-alanyl-lipoteichoic acid acyltransferase DltB (MBOAT superfamily)
MAIGLGEMFGFTFEENFNYPYISKSVTEFWRRWHISLGQWFRDYVYIPLGGSRVSVPRHLLNMLVVWLLTGIWHGAAYTFIVWGLGYFLLLVIEKYIIKPEQRKSTIVRIIWQIITLLCINFGWVIFNASGIKSGIKYCLSMVGYYGQRFAIDGRVIEYAREYGIYIFFGILFSTPIMKWLKEKISTTKAGICTDILSPICYGILFLWAVSFIILGAHNPFIYFNF